MKNINYFVGIVRILENPMTRRSTNSLITEFKITEVRAQLPQYRKTKMKIIKLVFWGNLALDVQSSYKVNDYVMIEGYLKLKKKLNLPKLEMTVSKIYPLVLK